MDRPTLRQTLVEMLEETTGEQYPNLSEDQGLQEGLGLDSVDMFTLIVEIQTRLQVKIASEEFGAIQRVGDLLDLLQAKLAAAQASEAA